MQIALLRFTKLAKEKHIRVRDGILIISTSVNNTAGVLDLSREEDQNKLCLGLPGCSENSLAGTKM